MSLPDLPPHSPDAAVLTCTAGLLLIYFEFNRPGLVLPGCAGLTLVLLATAALLHDRLTVAGPTCLAAAILLLLWGLRRGTSIMLALVTGVAIAVGFMFLVDGPGPAHVQPWAAVIAGILLGPGTSFLTAIARRARVNKGLD